MTVGVWVGRPDGAPVPGLVGRAVAAPILFDAFARSGLAPMPLARAPKGALFAASNKLPPPLQRFTSANGPGPTSEPPRIMYPPDGARIEVADGRDSEPVALKIAGGLAPLTVMVNGVPLASQAGRRTLFFQPDGLGFVRLTVMDARGAADSVMVRVQ
jgi:penicillin-binding protein 1C